MTRLALMHCLAALPVLIALSALADDTPAPPPPAKIELNEVAPVAGACRLTFTAQSTPGLTELMLETVLFKADGAVAMLTLFDFRDVPAGRLRVRQFDVPDLECDDLGRILFNGMEQCTRADATPCTGLPQVGSRTDVEVLG